jgi:hypothetical protein
MADIFDRYHECDEIVNSMPDGINKDHAKTVLRQLLHIEQARKVAHDNYNRYRDEMNSWENNLVRDIKRIAKGDHNATAD